MVAGNLTIKQQPQKFKAIPCASCPVVFVPSCPNAKRCETCQRKYSKDSQRERGRKWHFTRRAKMTDDEYETLLKGASHQARIYRPKVCRECGCSFIPTGSCQKMCGDCGQEFWKQRKRELSSQRRANMTAAEYEEYLKEARERYDNMTPTERDECLARAAENHKERIANMTPQEYESYLDHARERGRARRFNERFLDLALELADLMEKDHVTKTDERTGNSRGR